jgi:cytochrome c peroxidase
MSRHSDTHKRQRLALGLFVVLASSIVFSLPPETLFLGRSFGNADREVAWTKAELATLASLSPIPDLPPSPSNRVATDPRAAELGRRLFFDKSLSKNGEIACASCHRPEVWFTDELSTSVGLQNVARNAPTIIGSQWSRFFYWDGRKDSLWSQAMVPFEAEAEMGTTRLGILHKLYDHYREPYEALFGELPPLDEPGRFPPHGRPIPGDPSHPHDRAWNSMSPEDRESITLHFVNLAKCIEAFERMLIPREASFDRYVKALLAGDPDGGGELSRSAIRGLQDFIGKAGCINCHNGPLFSDASFHNTGLPLRSPEAIPEPARARGAWQVLADPFRSDGKYGDDKSGPSPHLMFLNPGFEDLLGAYKTSTLRNIAKTGPYGHAGQIPTLAAMVEHYRKLPIAKFLGHRDLTLKPLDRNVRTEDLVAFLESLTGPLPDENWLSAR